MAGRNGDALNRRHHRETVPWGSCASWEPGVPREEGWRWSLMRLTLISHSPHKTAYRPEVRAN
ncbi:hypothetical protein GCM10010420_39130 [Streptomyces glaucosporus]|uniref:Uncharacterized protein n=1 Tax=Streptomyces glaucosporus TaxID=284044 RepID=A0ABN3IMD4_9ACTN